MCGERTMAGREQAAGGRVSSNMGTERHDKRGKIGGTRARPGTWARAFSLWRGWQWRRWQRVPLSRGASESGSEKRQAERIEAETDAGAGDEAAPVRMRGGGEASTKRQPGRLGQEATSRVSIEGVSGVQRWPAT